MVGPTGTGKSTYINRHLVQGLPKEKWTPIMLTMSARTTGNMTQEQVGILSLSSCKRRLSHGSHLASACRQFVRLWEVHGKPMLSDVARHTRP